MSFPDETRRQLQRAKWFRNRATGAISHKLAEVLPHKLTVRRDFDFTTATMFDEVEIVPFEETLNSAERALRTAKERGDRMELDQYLRAYEDVLTAAIEAAWNPAKFKIVLHSSGWDTRITSALVRDIYERRGDDWLGDVLFACFGGEGPAFRAVMQREGWGGWQHFNHVDYGAYFDRCTDFEAVGAHVNHLQSFALDFYYVMVRELQRLGLVPEDDVEIQIWTGYWGTYMDRGTGGKKFMDWLERLYHSHQVLGLYTVDDAQDAFGDYRFIRFVLENRAPIGGSVRKAWLTWHDPELSAIERTQPRDHTPPVPAHLVQRTVDDYRRSWYGQHVAPGAESCASATPIHNRPWWMWWTRAAMCEHLLRQGYELTTADDE